MTPYRDGEVKDVEYETPKKPWHKSTVWFVICGASGAVAWASWNVAYHFQGMLAGNATALGLLSSILCAVSGITAGMKRWS